MTSNIHCNNYHYFVRVLASNGDEIELCSSVECKVGMRFIIYFHITQSRLSYAETNMTYCTTKV